MQNIRIFASAVHIHSRGTGGTKQTGRRPVNLGNYKPAGEPATCSLLFREPSKRRQSEELGTPLLFPKLGKRPQVQPRASRQNLPQAGEVGPDLDSEEALLLAPKKKNTLVIY